MPRSLTGDLIRLGLAYILGAALLAGYTSFRIWQVGEREEQSRPVDAIVVLGAAQYDGRPSPVFRARLDHAVGLYLNGVAPYLVLTGGRAAGDRLSEAEVALAYARDRGVPPGRMIIERTGHDTLASLRNVARLLDERGLDSALFVSDRTHMLRVLRIAEDLGLETYGSPTRSSPVDSDPPARLGAILHELGALAAYHLLGR